MEITRNQWFAIGILFCTVVTGGTAQLSDLIGPGGTKIMVSLCTLITGFLAGLQIILGGNQAQAREVLGNPANQDAIVRNVLAMPGVENLEINRRATPALASLAVDTSLNKIAPKPSDTAAITATAAANPTT